MSAVTVELANVVCGTCGVAHAIPRQLYDTAKREGGYWTCPNGHSLGWAEGSEKEELRKMTILAERHEKTARQAGERADREVKLREYRIAALERRLVAQRAATTRARNRAREAT